MTGCVDVVSNQEIRTVHHYSKKSSIPGIFPALIDRGAFIDRLALGVNGKRRRRSRGPIQKTVNRPIGGPGRPYARSERGIFTFTGNPFEMKYGSNRLRFPNLPDVKVIIRSEATPIDPDEVTLLLDSFFRKGHRVAVHEVEFTRDVSLPFKFFENHIISRASVRTLEDENGRKTLYAGKPGGRWMLRIYQKNENTTRIEVVLRHSFLARNGINRVDDLGKLRHINFAKLISFPAICRHTFEDLVQRVRQNITPRQLQLIQEWPDRRPTQILLDVLRAHGLPGEQILRPSPAEKLLADMQKSFVWGTK